MTKCLFIVTHVIPFECHVITKHSIHNSKEQKLTNQVIMFNFYFIFNVFFSIMFTYLFFLQLIYKMHHQHPRSL